MIKTQFLLWKTIEGNRRLKVRVRVRGRFLLFYSELAPTDPSCNMLQTLLGRTKHEETMSDVHPLTVGSEDIEVVSAVDALGIAIDNKFNFNLKIERICKSALDQLQLLMKLKQFYQSEGRKTLINSFVLSNFNYCSLVWSGIQRD